MAGINLTPQRRSQLLELLLSQQAQRPQIQTGLEAALRLGAQGVRQKGIRDLQKQEQAQQQKLVDALSGTQRFEQIEGGPPALDPQRIDSNKVMADRLAQLPIEQQAEAAHILQMKRELEQPTRFEQQRILQERDQDFRKSIQQPKDNRTSEQKNYAAAVENGFKGSFTEFIALTRIRTQSGEKAPFDVPSGFMLNPDNPSLGPDKPLVVPITGGPKDTLSPEAAAKTQLVESALESSQKFREFIINEDGSINRTNIFNAMLRTPFTEGREANVFLLDSIEAKLRAESGAAVPETEVKRAGKRFRPSPLDSDTTVKAKADLMADFLEGAFDKTNRDGRFDVKRTVETFDRAAERRLRNVDRGLTPVEETAGFDNLTPEQQEQLRKAFPDGVK